MIWVAVDTRYLWLDFEFLHATLLDIHVRIDTKAIELGVVILTLGFDIMVNR